MVIWVGPMWLQRPLNVKEGGRRGLQSEVTWEESDPPLLALKIEEGSPMSHWMRETSKTWKRQGNLYPRATRKELPADTFDCWHPMKPMSDLWPTELLDHKPLNLWWFVTAAMKTNIFTNVQEMKIKMKLRVLYSRKDSMWIEVTTLADREI